jgi:uncharacterized membrane protein
MAGPADVVKNPTRRPVGRVIWFPPLSQGAGLSGGDSVMGRTRLAIAVMAAALATAGVAQPVTASTAVACAVRALPVPDGTNYSLVNGTDRTGRYLAGFAATDDVGHAVLWHDGVPTVLPIPLSSPTAGAVNSHGAVVGTGFLPGSGDARAWEFVNGRYLELAPPAGGTQTFGVGINKHGDVLLGYDSNFIDHVAVRSADGVLRTLQLPPGYSGIPTGISDDGTVTARASLANQPEQSPDHSFVWDASGVRYELPGTAPGVIVDVWASAGHWAVGGQFDLTTGTPTALRWDLRTRTVETLPAELTSPLAVNDRGIVGGQAGRDAALVRNGQVIRLPSLSGTAGGSAAVQALSHTGVAAGSDFTDTVHAVSWTCQ